MFHTQPEAELKFPRVMNSFGERSWQWIEIAIHIPLFLVSGDMKLVDGTVGRDWIFGNIRDVLNLIDTSSGTSINLQIGLLSPGHMNGSNSYQLGKVKEIWRHPNEPSQLFVLVDGTKLRYSYNEDSENDHDMELVLSL